MLSCVCYFLHLHLQAEQAPVCALIPLKTLPAPPPHDTVRRSPPPGGHSTTATVARPQGGVLPARPSPFRALRRPVEISATPAPPPGQPLRGGRAGGPTRQAASANDLACRWACAGACHDPAATGTYASPPKRGLGGVHPPAPHTQQPHRSWGVLPPLTQGRSSWPGSGGVSLQRGRYQLVAVGAGNPCTATRRPAAGPRQNGRRARGPDAAT